ncbi:hypothetical protein VPH35_009397 [Triticum aestivum]
MGVNDSESRRRAVASAGSFNAGHRHDEDHDEGDSRPRGQQDHGGGRKRFWRGMHEQAQCRDMAMFNLQPRRHRNHDGDAGPASKPLESRPQSASNGGARAARRSESRPAQWERNRVLVTPSWKCSRCP